MEKWGRSTGSVYDNWPKNENGEPEEAKFLLRCRSNDMAPELKINMLAAYGIPCVCRYPGDGGFGKVLMGMSGNGVDIFVPESMYEDAVQLCREENENEL